MAMNGFRARIQGIFFGKSSKGKPVIMTEFGPVTESARLQAALNMKNDPEVRKRVLGVLTKQLGSIAKAEIEMRRRYPEAYEE